MAYLRAFKMSRYGFTGPLSTLEIVPIMKLYVFTLFGMVMNSNGEFCTDCLFHLNLIVFKDSCVPLNDGIICLAAYCTSLVRKGCGAL